MKVCINTKKELGPYIDPTCWQNSTLRYVPPVDFPAFLASRLGRAKIMRTFITLDEYWDYRTDTTYPDFDIGVSRYPVEELHFPYDWALIVPAPSGTRFVDYLTSHSKNAEELLLNVRRYEREVSDGVITYDQYENLFYRAVKYCKELAPNIRYVECSNEVDIAAFGNLTAQEYVNIYLRAHRAIQRLNEENQYDIPLELGGFAEAHPILSWSLMEEVMELLKDSEIGSDPMRFYSYHMYNNPENRKASLVDHPEVIKLSGVQKIQMIYKQHVELLQRLNLPERPVFLNEMGRARATGVDWDSMYNAAGNISYMIAFSCGAYGDMKPFPWCTFHNPKLQMSYTQYLRREDGSYAATPNGIAMEMLHGLSGQRLALEVSETDAPDAMYSTIAVRDGDEISIVTANLEHDADLNLQEIVGLENRQYCVDYYICNIKGNNIITGTGDGSLQILKTKVFDVTDGVLRIKTILDRDCFTLFRIRPIV